MTLATPATDSTIAMRPKSAGVSSLARTSRDTDWTAKRPSWPLRVTRLPRAATRLCDVVVTSRARRSGGIQHGHPRSAARLGRATRRPACRAWWCRGPPGRLGGHVPALYHLAEASGSWLPPAERTVETSHEVQVKGNIGEATTPA